MDSSTTSLTKKYIDEHPYVKSCLKMGLINYSSLARLIGKELGLGKSSSMEAALIAARRYSQKIRSESLNERMVMDILSDSELSIKNRIVVYIIEKADYGGMLGELEKSIRSDRGIVYVLELSGNYTIITQDKYARLIEAKMRSRIVASKKDLVLISIITPKDVEITKGFVSFIAGLFAENGVNIIEFLSSWTDTLIVIAENDLGRAIGFLKFSNSD